MDGWDVLIWLHSKLKELLPLVDDAVLLEVLRHVEHLAHALPSVGCRVHILVRVTVQNLVERLF